MNKEKYKGYKGCLQPVYDGERDDSSFIRTFECPIVPLSFTEKVVFLNNYILGAGLDGEFWPTSPLVRILVRVGEKHFWKTFLFDGEYDLDCDLVIKSMNEFIRGFGEDALLGDSEVRAYVAPNNGLDDHYLIASYKNFLIFKNAYRELDYNDFYSFFLISCEMIRNDYASLCDVYYDRINPESEQHNKEIYGSKYMHLITMVSCAESIKEPVEAYQNFATVMLEEYGATIMHTCPIDTDGDKPNVANTAMIDFVTVIVDKEYGESDRFENEVLPLTNFLKTIIVYVDDTRLSSDRLCQLNSYLEFVPGNTSVADLRKYLQISIMEIE